MKESQILQEKQSERDQDHSNDKRSVMWTWQHCRNIFIIDNIKSLAPSLRDATLDPRCPCVRWHPDVHLRQIWSLICPSQSSASVTHYRFNDYPEADLRKICLWRRRDARLRFFRNRRDVPARRLLMASFAVFNRRLSAYCRDCQLRSSYILFYGVPMLVFSKFCLFSLRRNAPCLFPRFISNVVQRFIHVPLC